MLLLMRVKHKSIHECYVTCASHNFTAVSMSGQRGHGSSMPMFE